jgi:hypothetical protein
MLFGMPLRDTGVKRYPMRCRPRIIQYAITLVLKSNDQHYLESLKLKLQKFYPLHQKTSEANAENSNLKSPQSSVMFIYYPGEFNLLEFLPLCGAFIIQFLYVHFSVRKIDVIRSRFILAVCSVITVLGSLVMSLGLCFFFGLTISMQSRSVFPYLVILVGLENVLVLTKSVVTTDDNLDVKIRVAQGECMSSIDASVLFECFFSFCRTKPGRMVHHEKPSDRNNNFDNRPCYVCTCHTRILYIRNCWSAI